MKPGRYFLGLATLTALGLGVVHQQTCLVMQGYEVERLSSRRDDLLDQHRVLNYNVLALRSPVILKERLAQLEIELAPPRRVEVLAARSRTAPGVLSSLTGQNPLPGLDWVRRSIRVALGWFAGAPQARAEPSAQEER